MNINKLILSFVIFASTGSLGQAKTNSTDQVVVLSAEQIVAKNIAARGGLKAWRSVHTMSMNGKMDAGKLRSQQPDELGGVNNVRKVKFDERQYVIEEKVVQLPFQMELKRPQKMRIEIQFQGDTAVQTYNGKNGWKLRPFLGRREVESFTSDEMKSAAQQQELDGFLIDYKSKGTKVESEGVEQVDGQNAYKLKLTLKDGQIRHAWVDTQTFLDVKVDGMRRMDGKPRTVMTYFHDFKSVNGVLVPYILETTVDGVKGSERILIDKVVLNPQLNDKLFEKPI
jgi:hypothetical protein